MMRIISTSTLALIAAVAMALPGHAADPKPFPDFTFKRVKVPTSGSGPRIKVQIEPTVEAEEETQTAAANSTSGAASTAYAWFWDEMSPSLSASGPGRLDEGLRVLKGGTGVPAPRVQTLGKILESHQTDILLATIGTNVSPALVLAVISVESGGRVDAESSAGAQGLMQLIPDTAARFGVEDSTNPAQNIKGGVAYLDWLMGEFDNDPIMVLAAYNAGEGSVRRYEGVPPYKETRGYVPKVLAAWEVTRGLCKTPPELISDGCAFAFKGS